MVTAAGHRPASGGEAEAEAKARAGGRGRGWPAEPAGREAGYILILRPR